MNITDFLDYVKTGKALASEEIHAFMDAQNDEARRITSELNGSYRTQAEIRKLLSLLFGHAVDPSLRVFPPFHTDFGKNLHIGKDVFINAGCHFQDHGASISATDAR